MKTLMYLKRDLRLGLLNRSYILIIAAIFSFVMVRQCSSSMYALNSINYMWSNGTVMDYFIYSLKGMNYYRFDPKSSFELPLLWFIFQMGMSYFIAYYAEKDYSDNGVYVIVSGRSRSSWWFAKMIWSFLSIVAYYLVSFVSCVLFACYRGADLSMEVSYDFLKAYFGYNMTYISYSDLIVVAVFVPIAVSIAICLVQLLLSFILSPVTSFAITCGVYVLSAYYTVWFLPGSFTMWLRSSYYDERGLNPLSGVLLSAFLVIVVCILGKEYFEKKDIIL